MRILRSFFDLIKQYNFKKYNLRPFIAALLLSAIGCMAISDTSTALAKKQAMGLIVIVFIFFFFTLVDYHAWTKMSWLLYAVVIVLLAGVLVFGTAYNSARRWFSFGPIGTVQPSEFAKILMILVLSKFIFDNREKINRLKTIAKYFLL
ncbi:MAG: FtsW/RodA/SpoVE family cell cycle protein, partial [Lachnospiraceae bacterium]|nr:FtsW/RodA/SpoVE family cell cycle protein [Lachnospiraceae bacterium]